MGRRGREREEVRVSEYTYVSQGVLIMHNVYV